MPNSSTRGNQVWAVTPGYTVDSRTTIVLEPFTIDSKTERPALVTYVRSGLRSSVTGVGTVTRTTSQCGTASLVFVVIFHRDEFRSGMRSFTSGSPVGFSPASTIRTVRSEMSTPQTLNPASWKPIAVGNPTYPSPIIPTVKSPFWALTEKLPSQPMHIPKA